MSRVVPPHFNLIVVHRCHSPPPGPDVLKDVQEDDGLGRQASLCTLVRLVEPYAQKELTCVYAERMCGICKANVLSAPVFRATGKSEGLISHDVRSRPKCIACIYLAYQPLHFRSFGDKPKA